MENKEKENLFEAYTDEDGFVWDENGDIVAIPEKLKKESDRRLSIVMQMVKEGKINVRK